MGIHPQMPANWTVLRVMPRVKNPHTNYGLRLSAIFDWYRVFPSDCVPLRGYQHNLSTAMYSEYIAVLT